MPRDTVRPLAILWEIEARFIVLPISGRACVRALGLPATYPKDPADRIIGATPLIEGLSLLTADRGIRRSGVLQKWCATQCGPIVYQSPSARFRCAR